MRVLPSGFSNKLADGRAHPAFEPESSAVSNESTIAHIYDMERLREAGMIDRSTLRELIDIYKRVFNYYAILLIRPV